MTMPPHLMTRDELERAAWLSDDPLVKALAEAAEHSLDYDTDAAELEEKVDDLEHELNDRDCTIEKLEAKVARLEQELTKRESVPEPLVPLGVSSSAQAYARGWNDCRNAMLSAAKAQEGK
jgi:seryl-tRNA synthetase